MRRIGQCSHLLIEWPLDFGLFAYLRNIRTQWLFTQHMNAFRNGGQRLARVDICAGRDPDSLETRLCQHLIIAAVDSNSKLLVLWVFFGPVDLVGVAAAHGYDLGARHTVQQGMNMSLALRDVSVEGFAHLKMGGLSKPCDQGQRRQSEEAA